MPTPRVAIPGPEVDMSFWNQLFAKKSLETLHAEAKGEHRLRRILGPINLTSLGVGAIIGAGIFVMTGRSAAQDAGPAILLSFVVAGLGCLFAALCYAEFASLAPVAGSAYTYAYATLGELLAWIIGWDLILEYAMACACVAASWSKYLNELLYVLFSWKVPEFLVNDPFSTAGAWLNLPALLITVAVTVILVIGIRESATTNAVLVGVKVGVVLFVIGVGIFFVNPANWTSIPPSDRVYMEDIDTIPSVAAKAVKEDALPTKDAEARIDAIAAKVAALQADLRNEKMHPSTLKAVAEQVKQQIRTLYWETARLPEKEAEERVQQLTAELRGWARVERKRAELDKEVDAGRMTAAKRKDEIDNLKKKLAKSTVPEEQIKYDQKLAEGKINQAQRDELLKQAKKEDAYYPSPGDQEIVAGLYKKVEEKAPDSATSHWGILGFLGLNKYLEKIDDHFRSPFMPYGLAGVIFGASIVFFAYIGFDAVSTHSEEAKRPARDVPIAILASLFVCTLLYIGVAAVLSGMVPYFQISPDAAVSNAFTVKGMESNNGLLLGASVLISIGALAGMTSVLLITFLSQARIFLAMSRDGLLPPAIFAAVHERFRTPHRSTMLTGGIIAVVAAITPIRKLEEMVNIGTLMAFIIVCGAVMLLRVQRPGAERPFRAPLIWVIGPLGIVVNLIMMLFLPLDTWLRLVVWLVIGLCIYYFYGLSRSTLGRQMRGLAPLPGVAAASAGPLPDGDIIRDKSVMMGDQTVIDPPATGRSTDFREPKP
jgi:amino acid transporter